MYPKCKLVVQYKNNKPSMHNQVALTKSADVIHKMISSAKFFLIRFVSESMVAKM